MTLPAMIKMLVTNNIVMINIPIPVGLGVMCSAVVLMASVVKVGLVDISAILSEL